MPEHINTEGGVEVFRIAPGTQNLSACLDFERDRSPNPGLLATNCYHSDILFSEEVGGLSHTLNCLRDASSEKTVLYLACFSNLKEPEKEKAMAVICEAASYFNNQLVVIREESPDLIPIPKLSSRFEGEFQILPDDLRNQFSARSDQQRLLNHWKQLEKDGRLARIPFKESLEFAARDIQETGNDVLKC